MPSHFPWCSTPIHIFIHDQEWRWRRRRMEASEASTRPRVVSRRRLRWSIRWNILITTSPRRSTSTRWAFVRWSRVFNFIWTWPSLRSRPKWGTSCDASKLSPKRHYIIGSSSLLSCPIRWRVSTTAVVREWLIDSVIDWSGDWLIELLIEWSIKQVIE